MQVLLRWPFSQYDAREPLASRPTMLFVLAVSGFVTYEVCGGWSGTKEAFLWVPEHLSAWLTLSPSNGWVKGLWTLCAFPLALWLLLGMPTILLRGATSLEEAWRRMALPLVVVVASAHMAKALEKVSTWGGFLPGALRDPKGAATALAIHAQTLPAPGPLLPHAVYAAVGALLVVLGLCFSIREARLANPSSWRPLLPQLTFVALLFTVCVIGWGFR